MLDDEAGIQTNQVKKGHDGWPGWLEVSGFDVELSGIVQGAGELKQVVCETGVQVGRGGRDATNIKPKSTGQVAQGAGELRRIGLPKRRARWMRSRECNKNHSKKYEVGWPESGFRPAIQLRPSVWAKLRTEDGDQP